MDALSLVLPLPPSLSLFLRVCVCVCRCRYWATGASAFECQRKPQRYNLDKRLLFKYVRCRSRRVAVPPSPLPTSLTYPDRAM